MTPFRISFALMIVLLFLFSAGCLGPADAGNRTIPTIANTLPATPGTTPVIPAAQLPSITPTPVPAWCPPQGNESFWITLDPINDLPKGDPIEIRGETNIPAGKVLDILTIVGYHHTQTRCGPDEQMRVAYTVHRGNGCNNTFSVSLDSINLRSDEQFAMVRFHENNSVGATQFFRILARDSVSAAPAPDIPGGLSKSTPLILKPVRDVKSREPLVITGYTGTFAAMSYALRHDVNGSDCGQICSDELAGGEMYPFPNWDDPQPFLLRFNTSEFDPGRYIFEINGVCSGESAARSFNITP
jgi:hypothetical protein